MIILGVSGCETFDFLMAVKMRIVVFLVTMPSSLQVVNNISEEHITCISGFYPDDADNFLYKTTLSHDQTDQKKVKKVKVASFCSTK
jgi:hypothetical protein